MAETSLNAYRTLEEEDELGRQQRKVYSIIKEEGPVTRQQIDEMTGEEFLQINAVCGRVRELLDKELVEKVGVRDGRELLDVVREVRY